jgi:predicted nuclease of restriction endonuclease-like (RecB) superfamily
MAEPLLPSDYPSFLSSIKEQVQHAQLKALVAVNQELILLYWHIGQGILERQKRQGWGSGVIEQLSRDLHAAFPEMRGFSPRNLGYMKSFALAYPDESILQTVSAKITWSHNTLILDKVKDHDERLWYIQKTLENGWSLGILELQIKTDLYHRSGKALTNFKATLPALDSDLTQDVLKDPYMFDFITTSGETKERHLQGALIAQIERFLLELSIGLLLLGVITA